MSHQTGITASDELKSFFSNTKDGRIRLIKVLINLETEKLDLDLSEEAHGSWEDDYDKLVIPQLQDKQPCYLLYRLDEQNDTGFLWLFISYSPDNSPVRQKMLFAATRATLKMEFGASQIKDDLFGTIKEDVTLNGYKRYLTAQHDAPPLTMAEEELAEIKRTEVQADIHVDTKHQTMAGVEFPPSTDALNALKQLQSKKITYVQLSLDLKNETIELELAESIEADEIKSKTPEANARYHVFLFKHSYEGDYLEQYVFIYSMPGYKCSIKERMLYSSCKTSLICNIESLGIEIEKKIEVDDPSELSKTFIYDEIHPPKNIIKQKFSKPKGPTKRVTQK